MGHRGHLRPWVGTGCMAEQVTSPGKDWHQPCRKCEKCGKTLMSGAMLSMGKPYCNHPCYAAVFGPTCVGWGGAESHTFKKTQVMETIPGSPSRLIPGRIPRHPGLPSRPHALSETEHFENRKKKKKEHKYFGSILCPELSG